MTDTHCIAVSFDPEVHAVDNRCLKVGYASRYPDYSRLPVKYVQFPSIVMKGQWLKAAGFDTGTRVDVRVMHGCIVLTARAAEPEESALMKSLRKKVEKLSARKQKQVLEFIGVIAGKGSKE
ncbi:endoribonuclease SymE [Citrobacter europaeus]|uniref:endoribonuclease SymE n=1 Tax=Citrobacter europaeus TaxID=1914243 RepID=UPI001BCA9676|nr:endoribonuclease SymE [Citrobacter europaeus]